MTRNKARWLRWWDIIQYCLIGTGCFLLAEPLVATLRDHVIQHVGRRPGIFIISLALVVGPWALRAGSRRWLAWSGFRHFFSYPPLWVAGLIASVMVLGLGAAIQDDNRLELAIALAKQLSPCVYLVPIILLIAFFVFQANRRSQSTSTGDDHLPTSPKSGFDFAKVIVWLETDDEVTTPADDLFGHDDIARRIARRLREALPDREAPTIAVIGELGSGKTTIARLVKLHVSKEPGLQIVRVGLWPYDSCEAAVRGILGTLVKGIANHVSTLGLNNLPEGYVKTIERFGGTWGSFARAFMGSWEPTTVLERVSVAAKAIGVRFVLWIEDMERFAAIESGTEASGSTRRSGLEPIRSLLHMLDRCDNVSVIIADTTLKNRIDVDKIARYVERIPDVDIDCVRALIRDFHEHANKESVSIIRPAQHEEQKFLDDDFSTRSLWSSIHSEHIGTGEAIARVLSTPRRVKELWSNVVDGS